MKFKTFLIVLLILSFTIAPTVGFSQDNLSEENMKMFFNNREIQFANDPLIVNNTIMVPMRQFFESLGTYVKWYGDSQEIISYKDNMFIKLQIDNTSAYVNGKESALREAPIISEDRTYVPMDFIAKNFDMTVEKKSETNEVFINTKFRDDIYHFLDGVFYKKHYLKDHNLQFSLPTAWEKVSETHFKYELYGGIRDYNLKINQELLNGQTIIQYISRIRNQLNINENLTISEINSINLNNGNYYYITLNDIENNNYNYLYFFTKNNNIFLFNFTFKNETTDESLENFTQTIMRTINLSSLTIDQTKEHYVEYDSFFENGFELDTEVFSNMLVENSFQLTGSIESDAIDQFKIIVNKNSRAKTFNVDVNNNTFDKTIYTPYRLGKHNITLALDDDLPENSTLTVNHENPDLIMDFSVVNNSNDDILYLIPSEYVTADNTTLEYFAMDQTYDLSTNYHKAEKLYQWIFENINFASEDTVNNRVIDTNELKNALEVYETKNGTNLELNFLYTALLRSIEIPARIVQKETVDEEVIINTEIYVNGEWIVTDLKTEHLNYIDDSYANTQYFDIYDNEYFNTLSEDMTILDY